MGIDNRFAILFVSTIFWLLYFIFFVLYYFTGHMADWDADWRVVMTAVMACNFVAGPILTMMIARFMYWRGREEGIDCERHQDAKERNW